MTQTGIPRNDIKKDKTVTEKTGIKYDRGKLRWYLLPWASVKEIVRVVTFGAEKYGPENWKELTDPDERYFSAIMRHLEAWRGGQKEDEETGMNHLAHAGCGILFLLWFDIKRRKDD